LPLLWLVGVFLPPITHCLSLVPECKCEETSNPLQAQKFYPESSLEHELLALTNQQRIRQGLGELIPDDALISIARDHSDGMARQGFISHNQPSGDLKTRMERAGYLYEVARENVASASTVALAQRLLLGSAPHRGNILATDVTRVGIGITRYSAPYDRHLYITEIFAGPAENYQPASVQDLAISRVNEMRGLSGAGLVQPDPLFENLALQSVSSLEVPVRREDLRRMLAASAGELHNKGRLELSRIDVAVQLLHNPKNLSIPEEVREKQAEAVATAVRQVTDSRNQTAFLVLTLIGFTR
jgi:uncharacterized protein YkwD